MLSTIEESEQWPRDSKAWDLTSKSSNRAEDHIKPISTMNEPIYRLIGAKIEQTRTVLGWTQDELAKKVGLTRTSITNIEAGRQRILLHDVEKFASAFNMNPKALLRGVWF